MKFLFFDIECSNCFDGIGKICEFGYVLTDEKFNILSKDVYPMSPGKGRENRFHLVGRKDQKDLELAWDYDFYYSQPEFPKFYEKLKKLMSDPKTICFGFDCSNDISFLYGTCNRYHLSQFNYVCYDVQKLAINYLENGRNNLKNTYLRLVGNSHIAEFQEHLSRDDALMTMKIFEALCVLKGLSSEEILKNSDCARTTFEDWLKSKTESKHIAEEAVNNTSDSELAELRNFVLDLKKLALANKDNAEPNIVSDTDAYKAKFIAENIKFEKDGDVLLFLTAMTVLNTYVKQDGHNKIVDYWFKDLVERLLLESRFKIFNSLKINYIDKELKNNNILIFELFENYQFSFHCVKRSYRNKILDEYKCKSQFWGIKNKNCINELFNRVLQNNIAVSHLTTIGENLIEKSNEYAEKLIENPESGKTEKKNIVNRYTRRGKLKSDAHIMWEEFYKACEFLTDNDQFKGKRFSLSAQIKEDLNLTKQVIEKLKTTKCIGVDSLKNSDYLIVLNEQDRLRFEKIFKEPYKGKYLLVTDFIV